MTSPRSSEILLVDPLALGTGHHSWYLRELGAALSRAGCSVSVITFTGMHAADVPTFGVVHAADELPLAGWFARRVLRARTDALVPSEFTGRWGKARYSMYGHVATISGLVVALRQARKRPQAALHFLAPFTLPALCLMALAAPGCRLFATVFTHPPAADQHAYQKALVRLYRRMMRTGRIRVIAQTPQIEDAWRTVIGPAVSRLELPAAGTRGHRDRTAARRALGLPENTPIIAVVGAITPAKGYIELFAALKDSQLEVLVLLAGDHAEWRDVDPRDVARECGWTERTIFMLRFLSDAEFSNVLDAADMVSLLYRNPDQSSGILAMCAQHGTPVLANRDGYLGEFVRSAALGIAVDKDDAGAVRDGIRQLLAFDGERPGTTRAALTWDQSARDHLAQYAGTA